MEVRFVVWLCIKNVPALIPATLPLEGNSNFTVGCVVPIPTFPLVVMVILSVSVFAAPEVEVEAVLK